MKRTMMYTNELGVSYYKLNGTYYSNNGWFRKKITKEEYEQEIARAKSQNLIEAPGYVDDLRFDYRELKKEIENQYKSISNFSRAVGISEASMFRKLENRNEFTISEIFMIMHKLNLTDFKKYFFTPLKLEVDEDEC